LEEDLAAQAAALRGEEEEAGTGYWDSEEEKYVDKEVAEAGAGLGPPGARGGEEAVVSGL
jgi:hypothetical protein